MWNARRVALVAAALSVVSFFVVDAVATRAMEARIQDRIACADARVDVTSWPALLGALRGQLGEVEIDIPDLEVGQRTVDAAVTLHGVSQGGGGRADRVEIAATVDWEQVGEALQAKLPDTMSEASVGASDEFMAITTELSTLLGTFAATVLTTVSTDGDELVVTPEFVDLGGQLLGVDVLAGRERFQDLLASRTYPLKLPAGLSLASARVDEDGLTVVASGTDLGVEELKGAGGGSCGSPR